MNFQVMFKTRFISMLVLLMTAATGAWATDSHWPDFNKLNYEGSEFLVAGIMIDGEIITADYNGWDQLEVAAFVGNECRSAGDATNFLYNGYVEDYGDPFPIIDGMSIFFNGDGGETLTFKMYNHATGVEYTACAVTYLGEAISIKTGEDHMEGWDDPDNPVFLNFTSPAAPAGYTVSMKEGTEDATSWTIAPAEATTTGVAAGTTVTATYSGTKKVKSVKAVKKDNPLATPLTIEAITNGTIQVSSPKNGMQYSLDGGSTKITLTATKEIAVTAGNKVTFYGKGTDINNYDGTKILGSGDGFKTKVYGNIMSLVDEVNFATNTTITTTKAFFTLFKGNTSLTDASQLQLPATTLTDRCYASMFENCNALTSAPALPATSLVTTCYRSMFQNCYNLTAAPELLAEKLATYCYQNMFYNCSKLASVTCLATSGINPDSSTQYWLSGTGSSVTGDKTFTAATEAVWTEGISGIPNGWKRLNPDEEVAEMEEAAYTAGVDLTPSADGKTWTLAATPAFDVELEVEYETELALSETTDNSAALTEWDGYEADVTLTRTLAAGSWNTFAAPFSTAIPDGWTVKELSSATFADGTLTLNFADATSIVAGKPYLVKVTTPLNFSTQAMAGVIVSKTAKPFTSDNVDFIPTLGATTIEGSYPKSVLLMTAGNTLKSPSLLPADIKGFRAYFQLKGDAVNAASFNLDLGEGETTAISEELRMKNEECAPAAAAYDLQGRRVAQPKKGLYIQNGKKLIIK